MKLMKQLCSRQTSPSDATPLEYVLSLVVCELCGLTGAVIATEFNWLKGATSGNDTSVHVGLIGKLLRCSYSPSSIIVSCLGI